MKKPSEKVIEKLKKGDIKPRPLWHFILFNFLIYTFSIIAVILGGLALSLVSYLLINQDWSISWPNYFYLIPYAWLLALAILYLLSYFNFKNLKRSYKYSKKQLLLIILGFTILVAIFLNSANLPAKMHQSFSEKSMVYQRIFDSQTRPWHRPNEGFISGEVIGIKNERLIIKDLNREIWQVKVDNLKIFEIGTSWRFIGKEITNSEFEAKQVRPWLRQRKGIK